MFEFRYSMNWINPMLLLKKKTNKTNIFFPDEATLSDDAQELLPVLLGECTQVSQVCTSQAPYPIYYLTLSFYVFLIYFLVFGLWATPCSAQSWHCLGYKIWCQGVESGLTGKMLYCLSSSLTVVLESGFVILL